MFNVNRIKNGKYKNVNAINILNICLSIHFDQSNQFDFPRIILLLLSVMNNLSIHEFNNQDSDQTNDAKKELPIKQHKNEIIEAVKNNQVVIIHGQTGCGKTTQVPRYLYESKLNGELMIGITQPRRIAAQSMAKRVAFEMGEAIGKSVGYEIRFDKKCGPSTKIKYMTDGILLNGCLEDKRLNEYQIIMIDEAHERSLISDVLLGILKLIIKRRSDLKVIISSATISVEKFQNYFEGAKVIEVKSGLFPVDVIYQMTSDYIEKAVELVKEIHLGEMKLEEQGGDTRGYVLIFLPGQEEIHQCCDELSEIKDVVAIPLYGSMDFESQKDVFEPVRPFETKVVVATNIAETSITIDRIKYVIDCGYCKQNKFDSRRGMEVLEDVRISKAQAEQRKGRAGRTQPGICYRLYDKSKFDSLRDEAVPEIYRKNLSEIYMTLRALTLNPKEFQFLDPPKPEELERAEKELFDLSLLNNKGELTGAGERINGIPVHPILGKVLLASCNHGCMTDVIRIVSMFTEKMNFIFIRPRKNFKRADYQKKQFHDPGGDHFTLLNVYNQWKDQSNKEEWCKEHFINGRVMQGIQEVITQIVNIMKKNKLLPPEKPSDDVKNKIKKCFVEGYFRNICIRQPRDVYLRVFDEEVFYIYGNSSLKDSKPKIIMFHDAIKSSKAFASGVMQLEEEFLRTNFKKQLEIIKFPKDIDKPVSF